LKAGSDAVNVKVNWYGVDLLKLQSFDQLKL
jgi:hypothetical protein